MVDMCKERTMKRTEKHLPVWHGTYPTENVPATTMLIITILQLTLGKIRMMSSKEPALHNSYRKN